MNSLFNTCGVFKVVRTKGPCDAGDEPIRLLYLPVYCAYLQSGFGHYHVVTAPGSELVVQTWVYAAWCHTDNGISDWSDFAISCYAVGLLSSSTS